MNGKALRQGSGLAVGIEIAVVVFFSLLVGVLIVRSAAAAVAFVAAVVLFLALARSPLGALSVLIFLIPFSMTDLFSESVAQFPGARPFLLLGFFVVLIAFINWKSGQKIATQVTVFAFFVVTLLLITVLRALPNVGMISSAVDLDFTPVGFFLSQFVKPLVYLAPMVVVARFVKDEKDITRITSVLVLSLVALSVYFLLYYQFAITDKGNIEETWDTVGEALGMWKGQAGFLYVVGFPMVLARFFVKKDLFGIAGIVLSIISVGFLYSRTAYVAVAAAFFLYMFFSNRAKFYPVLLVGAVALSFVISDTVVERAEKGIKEEDLNQVASGRIDRQWIPLAEEYLEKPVDLMFGRGRFAVLTTRVWQSGVLPGASHPHNMFLEMILDAGLLGLLPFLALIAGFLLTAYRWLPHIRDRILREYLCGALVAVICNLMGGMTTGSMFPQMENSHFWFSCGLILAIIRVNQANVKSQTQIQIEEPELAPEAV